LLGKTAGRTGNKKVPADVSSQDFKGSYGYVME